MVPTDFAIVKDWSVVVVWTSVVVVLTSAAVNPTETPVPKAVDTSWVDPNVLLDEYETELAFPGGAYITPIKRYLG